MESSGHAPLAPEQAVATARMLATCAHRGQVDKSGAPYIGHPARVAERVACRAPDRPAAVSVAWLHDVVEDTDLSLEDLRAAGFTEEVLAAVDAVTRRSGEAAGDYYARVLANPLALLVKQADLDDNSSPERLALLAPEVRDRLSAKYARARELLDAPTPPPWAD